MDDIPRDNATLYSAPPVVDGTPRTLACLISRVFRLRMHGIRGGLTLSMSLMLSLALAACAAGARPTLPQKPRYNEEQLLDEVQHRAFRYFVEQADPNTGLVNDRARNQDKSDYTVASIAATGYGLAALPVGVEHHWISRKEAEQQALRTLRFVDQKLPNVHGWYYHFVDKRTGERVWNCELSSIDSGLLTLGAMVCGRYFAGTEVERLAERIYARIDWTWMLTNGGAFPDKHLLSHGWTPEMGFLKTDWDTYSEGILLYLLGMGAEQGPLPSTCWDMWRRNPFRYKDVETLTGGPIFLHEMAQTFYDFRNRRDRLGYDYWVSATNGIQINRQFCIDCASKSATYGPDLWGLNASDGPKGYKAYGVPGPQDGTVCPTGAIASIICTPEIALSALHVLYERQGTELWGRYGFGDAFNVEARWYDADVIGIDLGMALLAIEDHRSGLIWKLIAAHPSTKRAYAAANLILTEETGVRQLRIAP